MISSRDLALIVLIAVVNFVFLALVGQVPRVITGIPGIGYAFSIFYAITITAAALLFEGRRWRMFIESILFASLSLPTAYGGAPFNIILRIPILIKMFIFDIGFNSGYPFFQKKNRLVWLSIFGSLFYFGAGPYLDVLILSLFYTPELLAPFYTAVSLMLPVIIVEAIAGGYIGYKIYKRVEKLT